MCIRHIVLLFFASAGLVQVAPAQTGRSLTAAEAVRLGLDQSPQVQAAREQASAAYAGYRRARSARLPSLNTQASYTRLSDNIPEISFSTDFLPGVDTTFTLAPVALNRYYTEISLEQPLFTGGRIHYGIRAAELGKPRAPALLHPSEQAQ